MLRLILVAAAIAGGFGVPTENNKRPNVTKVGVRSGHEPAMYQLAVEWNNVTLCSAAVVGKYYAVTAAHCIIGHTANPEDVKLRVVAIQQGKRGLKHRAVRIALHESYTPEKGDNDVAVIQVKKPFHVYRLLKLTTRKDLMNAMVSGWGAGNSATGLSTHLEWMQEPILDKASCLEAYRGTPEATKITDRMFCVGGKGKGKCMADNGSLMVVARSLIGIKHASKECGGKYPDVYTNMTAVKEWIVSKMMTSPIGNDTNGTEAPDPNTDEPPEKEIDDEVAERPAAAGRPTVAKPRPRKRRSFSMVPFQAEDMEPFQIMPFRFFSSPVKDRSWSWVSASAGSPPVVSSGKSPSKTAWSKKSKAESGAAPKTTKRAMSLSDFLPSLSIKLPAVSWPFNQIDDGSNQPPRQPQGMPSVSEQIAPEEPDYNMFQFSIGSFPPAQNSRMSKSGQNHPGQPFPMGQFPFNGWMG